MGPRAALPRAHATVKGVADFLAVEAGGRAFGASGVARGFWLARWYIMGTPARYRWPRGRGCTGCWCTHLAGAGELHGVKLGVQLDPVWQPEPGYLLVEGHIIDQTGEKG